MRREISAGVVIFRKEGEKILYLLLHYESGHWDFVKGNIEEKESVEETVRRETKEEVGLGDLDIIEDFKESIKYMFTWPPKDPKAERIFKIVTFRLAKTKIKVIKLSFEHIGFEWLPYKEALERLTFKNAKEILKKSNDHLSEKSL